MSTPHSPHWLRAGIGSCCSHVWTQLLYKAAGGGNHPLRVMAADAQHNMLHPRLFAPFYAIDHLPRRTTDGRGTRSGIVTVAKRKVVDPCRDSQTCWRQASPDTQP